LFYSEVPVIPVIADRTLGSPPSPSSVFSAAAAALPLAVVAAPPEGNSCSSATPRVARKPCHRLSASPLSSPTHATSCCRRPKPPRRTAGQQQLLWLACASSWFRRMSRSPSQLLLSAHAPAFCFFGFSSTQHPARPPPRSLLAVVSRLRRPTPTIPCSTGTTAPH
jgi:hypothetical protein